jgi:Zn-dependent protease with chaperone function
MIPMRLSRVLLALPVLLGIMVLAQIIGGALAPTPSLNDSYASVGLLVAVGLIALELPRIFEFLAARDDVGPAGARGQVTIARLAHRGVVPFLPRLHVIDSKTRAAISLGVPGEGVIFITNALVNRLDDDALEVTLVHELQHLAKRHTLFHYGFVLSVIVTKMVLGLSAWFAPVLLFIYLAVLRRFEYMADAGAAAALGPERVAAALRKVQAAVEEEDFGPAKEFMSTHPPFPKRIARVMSAGRAAASA